MHFFFVYMKLREVILIIPSLGSSPLSVLTNLLFSPSRGAFGGILVCWNSYVFSVMNITIESFVVQLTFTSNDSSLSWTMATIYEPCTGVERSNFLAWLYSLQIPVGDFWLLLGDFNFYRSVLNRNKPGADMNDIFLFNEVISNLGLVEVPIKGMAFTWSNMQNHPQLEQLDWFFTSTSWSSSFPNTLVKPLARSTSDHTACIVQLLFLDQMCSGLRIYRLSMKGFLI